MVPLQGKYVLDYTRLLVHNRERLVVGACASDHLHLLENYEIPKQYHYCDYCFNSNPFSPN